VLGRNSGLACSSEPRALLGEATRQAGPGAGGIGAVVPSGQLYGSFVSRPRPLGIPLMPRAGDSVGGCLWMGGKGLQRSRVSKRYAPAKRRPACVGMLTMLLAASVWADSQSELVELAREAIRHRESQTSRLSIRMTVEMTGYQKLPSQRSEMTWVRDGRRQRVLAEYFEEPQVTPSLHYDVAYDGELVTRLDVDQQTGMIGPFERLGSAIWPGMYLALDYDNTGTTFGEALDAATEVLGAPFRRRTSCLVGRGGWY